MEEGNLRFIWNPTSQLVSLSIFQPKKYSLFTVCQLTEFIGL